MSHPGQRPPPILAARGSTSETASDASTQSPRTVAPAGRHNHNNGDGGGGGSGGNSDNGQGGNGNDGGSGRSRPKRTLIESACSACRRRKSRCDGVRPACSRCQALRTDCMYEAEEGESRWSALRRRNQILETERAEVRELLAFVQTLSEPDAQDVFNRIRNGAYDDIFRLLRDIRDGGVPTPTSSVSTGAQCLPMHPSAPGDGQNRLPPISAMFDLSSPPGVIPQPTNMPPPPPPPPSYYLKSEQSHGSTSSGATYPSEPPVTTGT